MIQCTVTDLAYGPAPTVGAGVVLDIATQVIINQGGGGGGSGTVTSVAVAASSLFTVSGSPVTTAGTITLALATQPANTVLAGPTTGAGAAPTFRALAKADLPASVAYLDAAAQAFIAGVTVYGGLYAPDGITASAGEISTGIGFVGDGSAVTNLNAGNLASGTVPDARLPASGVMAGSYTLATITVDAAGRVTAASSGSAGGTGTVTSVGLTAPGILSVGGSPVTGSGTLALSLATQSANQVFAGPPTGADAAPAFRTLAKADLPALAASDVGAQPADAELAALSGLASAADTVPYFTGSGTAALASLTSAGRTLIAAADAAGQRAEMGLGGLAVLSTVDLAADVTGVLPAGNLPATVVYGDTADLPHRVGWVLARGTPATTGTNKAGVKVRLPYAGALEKVWVDAETGPTGADLIIDIKLNGTSLWSVTPANRPKITAGATSGTQTAFDTATYAAGDYLTVDIAQVGSTVAGQDIAVALDMLMKNQ